MFEHSSRPLLSRSQFFTRVFSHFLMGIGFVAFCLCIGVAGYHYLESLSWLDSLLNASMILGGMGPVDTLHTDAGKLFASVYALFSGIVILVVVGVIIAPVVHRFLHRFHLEMEEAENDS